MRIARILSLGASAVLHAAALVALALLRPSDRGAAEPAPHTWGTATTFVVAPLAPTPQSGDEVLGGAEKEKPDAALDDGDRDDLLIPGFDFDIATIRAHRNWLFPFLTTDFLFLERAEQELRSANGRMVNPYASRRPNSSRPALWISDTEVQGIVDRAWSRRERWSRFSEIATLVARYDLDEGRVPALLRAYLDQNLLQPYHDTSIRDPRFWAMLSCVADHVEFVDWIRSVTRERPSSRTTTELLFLLDELAQGSRDTLLMLLATNPDPDLRYTRDKNRAAYDFAVSVRRQYAEWLAQRQLESGIAVRRRYDQVRLRILSTIVENTPQGYRAADAQFLAGEILFNQNDLAGAVQWWLAMRPHHTDSYAVSSSEILRELRSASGPKAVQIHRILGAEYRRWLDFSQARLQRFGHRFDTF